MKLKFIGNKIRPLDAQINKSEPSLVPKLPFSLQIVGQKGASKSTTILNMLLNKSILGGQFHEIYWISPTSSLDEKLDILKQTKGILKINYPLINEIKKNMKNSKRITDVTGERDVFEFNTSLTESNFIQDVSTDFLEEITNDQKKVIQKYGKKLANEVLLIFDDCSSARKFWNSEITKKLVFNSRHVKISLILSVQTYTSISKAIRLNNSILVLYATANEKEIQNIYQENSNNTFKEFLKIFKSVTDTPFSFLTINYQNDLKYRYINNFEEFII